MTLYATLKTSNGYYYLGFAGKIVCISKDIEEILRVAIIYDDGNVLIRYIH